MYALENVVQEYAWGSRTAIAELLGRASPSSAPQAELWMGAHAAAPSRVSGHPLADLIAAEPESLLGARVLGRLGPNLPFLLKVLAAAEPLSLQAHPTKVQAEAGYDSDQAAGIPLGAKHRNYQDRNHKPELLCALTEFDALCGFRPVEATLKLLEMLAVPGLETVVAQLRRAPDEEGVRAAFTLLMRADPTVQRELVTATAAACGVAAAEQFSDECAWALHLQEKYPGDIGVVSSLFLNLVRLQPGEAIYLPAGNLHAYLRGVGVEIMASSDNVLRGGLTPKHVNVAELLRVLDFAPLEPPRVVPRRASGEFVYETAADEFQLSRIELDGEWLGVVSGPEIVLCTAGALTIGHTPLPRGASVFVPASTSSYRLQGTGTAFRATVP